MSGAEYKPEPTTDLADRRAKMAAKAHQSFVENEKLTFAIDKESLEALCEMSDEQGISIGSMVNQWVLDRLTKEKLQKTQSPLAYKMNPAVTKEVSE